MKITGIVIGVVAAVGGAVALLRRNAHQHR